MEFTAIIMNSAFQVTRYIDDYFSFIWNEQFIGAGDFELEFPASDSNLDGLEVGGYVSIRESARFMIIERINLLGSFREGNRVRLAGRSLESILDRRCLIKDFISTTTLSDALLRLINSNFVSNLTPDNIDVNLDNRKVGNISSVDVSEIPNIKAEFRYDAGENIYDIICDMCNYFKLGFYILLDRDTFLYSIYFYVPINHSYEQTENPYVVFSNKHENLDNTDMMLDISNIKNTCIVINSWTETEKVLDENGEETGEEKEVEHSMELVIGNEHAGLKRKEVVITMSQQPEKINKDDFGKPEDRVNMNKYTMVSSSFDAATYRKDLDDYYRSIQYNYASPKTTKKVIYSAKSEVANPTNDPSAQWIYTRVKEVPLTAAEQRIENAKANAYNAFLDAGRPNPSDIKYSIPIVTWAPGGQEAYIKAMNEAATAIEQEYRAAVSDANNVVYGIMRQKAQEELAKYSTVTSFQGVVDHNVQYIYGRDYALGDVVQIVDTYGFQAKTRIVSLMISQDNQNGYMVTPTFESDDEAEVIM